MRSRRHMSIHDKVFCSFMTLCASTLSTSATVSAIYSHRSLRLMRPLVSSMSMGIRIHVFSGMQHHSSPEPEWWLERYWKVVGGSLPRCDQGDREYYCATMLTLFKPWRSGKCLKKEDQSFDEAFNSFNFTIQQTQYMKNFNLRYECNDA
jgi:hypothetical protein